MFHDGLQLLFAAAEVGQLLKQGFFRTVLICRRQFIGAACIVGPAMRLKLDRLS